MWNWIPSNIWVGVGQMSSSDVTFEIAPIYKKQGIIFHQAKCTEIYPEGLNQSKPFIKVQSTSSDQFYDIECDYIVNATGPKLNFAATPGLGPHGGHTQSVCTVEHAVKTSAALDILVEEMKRGHNKTLVVGTGHGMCTCEGAAFEYIFNLEFELRRRSR
jgi:sulfide:quinone oxidoreductase